MGLRDSPPSNTERAEHTGQTVPLNQTAVASAHANDERTNPLLLPAAHVCVRLVKEESTPHSQLSDSRRTPERNTASLRTAEKLCRGYEYTLVPGTWY